jgi:hypothetical protein
MDLLSLSRIKHTGAMRDIAKEGKGLKYFNVEMMLCEYRKTSDRSGKYLLVVERYPNASGNEADTGLCRCSCRGAENLNRSPYVSVLLHSFTFEMQ